MVMTFYATTTLNSKYYIPIVTLINRRLRSSQLAITNYYCISNLRLSIRIPFCAIYSFACVCVSRDVRVRKV